MLRWEQLAPEVIEKVKTGLLDFFSCAYQARELPWGQQAIRLARQASGRAAIIGTGYRSGAGDAAFANAVLGHGLVREDMHPAAVSHLGVVLYPVLLALAEGQTVSGRDFILAAICGYEVGGAVGRAILDPEIVRQFRPTGITGPLAGAMAGARLLALDDDAAASALGLAANATGGLNEWPYSGADDMFFHPGFAARNAVTAVHLAQLGARASETALDGRAGLFAAFRKSAEPVAIFGDKPLEILSVYYKPAPACNYAQTACQAAVGLRVSTCEITRIQVKLPAAAVNYPGCNYGGPFERILQAKMSIQYCVAATLLRGVIEEANYRLLSEPEVLRLARITELEVDPEFDRAYPRAQGAEVAVTFRSGEVLRNRLADLVPATPGEIRSRFRAACGSASAAIEAFVNRLEQQNDISPLLKAL